MASIDVTQIVDREFEAGVLEAMLTFDGPRRVLVVSGGSGMGKSDVLRKLKYLCEYQHEVPAALIDLRDFESRPEEFAIVDQLTDDLSRSNPNGQRIFPTFDALNNARGFRDAGQFYQTAQRVLGEVDLANASITGGTVAGVVFQIANAERVIAPEWSDQAEKAAKLACMHAFFSDLETVSRERPLVILIDTVESAGEQVKSWIFRDLLRHRLLKNWDAHRVIVVLAGQDAHDQLRPRLAEDQHACVEPVSPKAEWTTQQVEDFLRAHGFGSRVPSLDPEDLEHVRQALMSGRHALPRVLAIAELYSSGPAQ